MGYLGIGRQALRFAPDQDCRSLQSLKQRVCSDDVGDSLFRFLVIEIIEGGESTLSGAVRVVMQARDDVEAVLRGLLEAGGPALGSVNQSPHGGSPRHQPEGDHT